MQKSSQYSVPPADLQALQTEYKALQLRQNSKRDTLAQPEGVSQNARSMSSPGRRNIQMSGNANATSQQMGNAQDRAPPMSPQRNRSEERKGTQKMKDEIEEKLRNQSQREVDKDKKEFIERQASSERQLHENQAASMRMCQKQQQKLDDFEKAQKAKQAEIEQLRKTNELLEQTLENLVVDEMDAKKLLEQQ